MATPPSADAAAAPDAGGARSWFDGFVRRGLATNLAGVVIGLAIGAGTVRPLRSAAQVACVTFFCWLFVDGGRLVVARLRHGSGSPTRGWPGWRWMIVVIVVGSLAGYTAGTGLVDLLTGGTTPGLLAGGGRNTLTVLLVAGVPGIVATYFFWSRSRLAASEALVQRASREAAEHRLRLLQSQLEPHMLFNTLANLRVLIGVDPARAQAMLDALIAFLRATLAASRATSHPLAAEFARLRDYLALMQVRMGARLAVAFDLPEALAATPVPPLLLQPLVENAIRHGLEPMVAGGRIEVRAARDGATLVLQVRDTGIGLRDGGASDAGTRFGLAQVRERLATLHGTAASVVLEPATDADGGTIATVRLPLPEPR
jgi:signal transduction histidine kinase